MKLMTIKPIICIFFVLFTSHFADAQISTGNEQYTPESVLNYYLGLDPEKTEIYFTLVTTETIDKKNEPVSTWGFGYFKWITHERMLAQNLDRYFSKRKHNNCNEFTVPTHPFDANRVEKDTYLTMKVNNGKAIGKIKKQDMEFYSAHKGDKGHVIIGAWGDNNFFVISLWEGPQPVG